MEHNDFTEIVRAVCRDVTGRQKRAEIEEELLGHLEDTYERNLAMGKDEETARTEAIAVFGDTELLREKLGAVHSFSHAGAASVSLLLFLLAFLLAKINILSNLIGGLGTVKTFAVGVLLLLALVRLRTANKQFRLAFGFQTAQFLLLSVVYQGILAYTDSELLLMLYLLLSSLLGAAVWFFSFSGFHALFKKYGADSGKKVRLNISMIVLPIGSIANGIILLLNETDNITVESWFFGIALFAFYLFTAVELLRLRSILWDVDAEYGISPWRKSPMAAIALVMVVCLVCPILCTVMAATKEPVRSDFVQHDTQDTQKAEQIRKKMLSLGMDEAILNELPDSEVLRYEHAVSVEHVDHTELIKTYGETELYHIWILIPHDDFNEAQLRTLIRIQPYVGEGKRFRSGYRGGLYQRYYPQYTVRGILPLADPEFFVSIQTKDGNRIRTQEPLTDNLDEWYYSTADCYFGFGFEFKTEEKQTVYFALTNTIASPQQALYTTPQSFTFILQTAPFTLQHKTVTEFARELPQNAYPNDAFMENDCIMDDVEYLPGKVGLEELTDEYNWDYEEEM